MSQKKIKQQKKQRLREREAAKQKKRKIQALMAGTIGALIILVLGFGIYHYTTSGGSESGKPTQTTKSTNHKQGSTGSDGPFHYRLQPVLGDPNAPVKIVEFGDYRCSVCYHFDQNFFPKIKKNFIQKGKVAFYFMNYPILGKGSVRAALASESVFHRNPDVFWKYHETVYAHRGPESEHWATTDYLVSLAKKYVPKIDAAQLRKDIVNGTYASNVKVDYEKGKALGVQGTPTLFVNGQMLSWPQTSQYPKLKAAINKAYKEAKQK